MNCTHPIYALDRGFKDNGARDIKILPKRPDTYNLRYLESLYGSGNIVLLPCGHCLACKVNYAKEWSIRCMVEASLYKENWFLTLTYDDEHLPGDFKVHKEDVQLFLKKLRHYCPGVRFVCSAEYGSSTHRPHYHLILFNCHIPDLKCISKGRFGGHYYESKLIRELWSKGNITFGEVTPNSCDYVARYTLKKINGDEFITMSLKPGIGGNYFLDNQERIYRTDGIYIKGIKYKVPRYCDKLLERRNPIFLRLLKSERMIFQRERYLNTLSDSGVDYDEQLYERSNISLIGKYRDKLKKGAL